MSQHNCKQFLAELGNIFIQFQIEMMEREKTAAAARQVELKDQYSASAQAENKTKNRPRNEAQSTG